MSEYWTVFSNYFDIFGVIWGGIKVGLLSFILSLILLLVFKRFVLVRRRYKALKYLAYSYYFIIPIVCLCFGFIYGLITTSRDQVIDKLPIYQTSIQSFIEHNFDFNIQIETYTDRSLDTTLDVTATNVQASIISQLKLTSDNQDKTKQFFVRVLESPAGINYIKSSLKDKISSTVGLDRQLVDEVFQIKLSHILTSELIIKIFAFYIKQMVDSFLIPIIILGCILLLIPLIEIIWAYYYNKRYQLIIKQANIK